MCCSTWGLKESDTTEGEATEVSSPVPCHEACGSEVRTWSSAPGRWAEGRTSIGAPGCFGPGRSLSPWLRHLVSAWED